jgi:hypothetical protein
MFVYKYIYTYIYNIHIYTYICICIYIYMSVCMCVCGVSVCVSVFATCVCVCVCVCVRACVAANHALHRCEEVVCLRSEVLAGHVEITLLQPSDISTLTLRQEKTQQRNTAAENLSKGYHALS